MDRLPYVFSDDQERIRAGHEREKMHTWMDGHVHNLVRLCKKLNCGNPLTVRDRKLMSIVFQNVISDIFHKRAEQEFLLNQLDEKGR